jgi:hypothetical protein
MAIDTPLGPFKRHGGFLGSGFFRSAPFLDPCLVCSSVHIAPTSDLSQGGLRVSAALRLRRS